MYVIYLKLTLRMPGIFLLLIVSGSPHAMLMVFIIYSMVGNYVRKTDQSDLKAIMAI
jgi:hypothetical protein